jgi:flagellar biosynthetic protein FliR
VVAIDFEVQKFILVFFRVVSMIWLLPLFHSRAVAAGYKAGLGLLVAFLLYPAVVAPDLKGDTYLITLAIIKEVLIGFSVGFFVRVLFAMVSSAAELISMQSGLSFARTIDPAFSGSATVLEQFKSLFSVLIFLGLDGHHIVLKGLAASLRQVPPGAVAAKPELFQYLAGSVGSLFSASLKICAPVVVTLFLVDLSLGILARLIPQVNVFVEGASIKIIITLTVLALSLNLIAPVIGGLFRGMEMEILKIIRYVG